MITKLLSSFVLLAAFFTAGFSQELVTGTLEHDGETREYSVYLPSGYSPEESLPMVFNLHGTYLNGDHQISYTEFNDLAEEENFIVVIPEGLEGTTFFGITATSWNSYWGTGIDDLGFLDALIDRVYIDYQIDLARVYCTGFSNGGYMSQRLACELSDRITAIASVAGSVVYEQLDNCTPDRAVPNLQIHGTNDGVVAYEGVPMFAPSITELTEFWVDYNNCSVEADTIDLPNIDLTDSSTVKRLEYNDGDEGAKVWLYIVENGEHSWPGAPYDFDDNITNRDFNASQHIWEFFAQFEHPNPKPVGSASIAERSLNNVEIISRPISNELAIVSTNQTIEQVLVFDMSGKTIIQETFSSTDYAVNLNTENLKNGIYVVSVKTESGVHSQKISL